MLFGANPPPVGSDSQTLNSTAFHPSRLQNARRESGGILHHTSKRFDSFG